MSIIRRQIPKEALNLNQARRIISAELILINLIISNLAFASEKTNDSSNPKGISTENKDSELDQESSDDAKISTTKEQPRNINRIDFKEETKFQKVKIYGEENKRSEIDKIKIQKHFTSLCKLELEKEGISGLRNMIALLI